MFKGFLFCVFSYNRGAFLQNTLDSIKAYYPEASLAIFDDGSDEEPVPAILNAYANEAYIHVTDKASDSRHGGLYNMMNAALDYAKNSQYKYVYFVQDDMQFLWRDENLPERLGRVFTNNDCIMCNLNFLQKIFKNDVKYNMEPAHMPGVFRFNKHGAGDTGIIDIEKARKFAFHFPYNSEKENSVFWYNKGFSVYWLSQPNLAWLPWPTVYRHKKKEKRRVNTLRVRNMKQLSGLNDSATYTYLEDYVTTERFLVKPYWYQANPGYINLVKIYVKYFLGIRLFK